MWDSMNAVNSWMPIQHQTSFEDGLTQSGCAGCKHVKEDKNVCMLRDDCPIRIPTILPPSDRSYKYNLKKRKLKKCAFPGCENMTSKIYCSTGCSQVVAYRRKKYPDNPELWHMPRRNPGGKRTLEQLHGGDK